MERMHPGDNAFTRELQAGGNVIDGIENCVYQRCFSRRSLRVACSLALSSVQCIGNDRKSHFPIRG